MSDVRLEGVAYQKFPPMHKSTTLAPPLTKVSHKQQKISSSTVDTRNSQGVLATKKMRGQLTDKVCTLAIMNTHTKTLKSESLTDPTATVTMIKQINGGEPSDYNSRNDTFAVIDQKLKAQGL